MCAQCNEAATASFNILFTSHSHTLQLFFNPNVGQDWRVFSSLVLVLPTFCRNRHEIGKPLCVFECSKHVFLPFNFGLWFSFFCCTDLFRIHCLQYQTRVFFQQDFNLILFECSKKKKCINKQKNRVVANRIECYKIRQATWSTWKSLVDFLSQLCVTWLWARSFTMHKSLMFTWTILWTWTMFQFGLGFSDEFRFYNYISAFLVCIFLQSFSWWNDNWMEIRGVTTRFCQYSLTKKPNLNLSRWAWHI